MVCELYLNKAVTKSPRWVGVWDQYWVPRHLWPQDGPSCGFDPLASTPCPSDPTLFIWPGTDSCHFPSLSPRSCLCQNYGVELWCWVRSGPCPEAPGKSWPQLLQDSLFWPAFMGRSAWAASFLPAKEVKRQPFSYISLHCHSGTGPGAMAATWGCALCSSRRPHSHPCHCEPVTKLSQPMEGRVL